MTPSTRRAPADAPLTAAPRGKSAAWLRWLFWIGVSGSVLALALRDVRLAEVGAILRQADWLLLGAALLSVVLNHVAKVARWALLVRERAPGIGWLRLTLALLVGGTLNWFVPGRVGDLTRAYVLGADGPGRAFLLGTVALEKVLDLVAYAMLFLWTLALWPLPGWLRDSGVTLALMAGVMIGLTGLLAWRPGWFAAALQRLTQPLPEEWRHRLLEWFGAGVEALAVLTRPGQFVGLAFWTLGVWATAVATNWLTAAALQLTISWTAALAVLMVLQAGISVPTTPGRFGVFQFLCILALAFFGVGEAAALSFGLLLQALILLPPTLASLPGFSLFGVGWPTLRQATPPDA
jgi:uncharacterized protein (TIRG00374 family)